MPTSTIHSQIHCFHFVSSLSFSLFRTAIGVSLTQLSNQVADNDYDILDLQREDIAIGVSLTGLSNQIAENDTDIFNLQQEDVAIVVSLTQLSNQVADNDYDILDLQEQDIVIGVSLTGLFNQIAENDIDIFNLLQENVVIGVSLTDLSNQIADNDTDIFILLQENVAIGVSLTDVSNQIAENDTDIFNLQTEDIAIGVSLTDLSNQIAENDTDIFNLQTEDIAIGISLTDLSNQIAGNDTDIFNLGVSQIQLSDELNIYQDYLIISGPEAAGTIHNDLVINGNLGVGTNAPSTAFHVEGNPIFNNTIGGSFSFSNTGSETALIIRDEKANNDTRVDFIVNGSTNIGIGYNSDSGGSATNSSFQIYKGSAGDTLVLASNDNVGIGTNNPSQKLHVNGDCLIQGGDLFLLDTNDKISSDGTDLTFHVNGSEAMKIENTGHVGIGTDNPQATLHLHGGNFSHSTTSGGLIYQIGGRTSDGATTIDLISQASETVFNTRIIRNSGANGIFEIENKGTGGIQIANRDASDILFLTDDTERMRLNSSGTLSLGGYSDVETEIDNLWISTTGIDGRIDTLENYIDVSGETINGDLKISYNESTTFLTDSDQGDTKRHFYNYNSSSTTNAFAGMSLRCASAVCDIKLMNTGSNVAKLVHTLRGTSSTFNDVLTLHGDGFMGINNSVPAYSLDVSGDAHITNDLVVDDDVSIGATLTIDGRTYFDGGYLHLAGSDTYINSAPANVLFKVEGNNMMFLDGSAEYIGINTVNPQSDLHVVGGELSITNGYGQDEGIFLLPSNPSDVNGGGRMFFKENSNNLYGFSLGYNGGGTNDILNWNGNTFNISRHDNSSDGSVVMAIPRNSGYIGIAGSQSPGVHLAFAEDDTGIHHPSTDTIAIHTNGNERLRVESGGNVGIGTNNPSQTLHVNGDILVGNNLYIGGSTVDQIGMDGTDMFFELTSSEKMRIEAGGNVGIGTSNPDQLLTIYGGSNPKLHIVNTAENDGGIKFSDSGAVSTQNFEILYNCSTEDLRIRSDSVDNIMYFEHTGDVGIHETSPSANLALANDSAYQPTDPFWQILSDERVKTAIENKAGCCKILRKLQLKQYNQRGFLRS